MPEPLGRVLDPAALADTPGPRGRHRVQIHASWAVCGAQIDLSVPARLACARCDGGGCDGCGRSGVVRAPDDPRARVIRVKLPPDIGEGVLVRIVRPFGDSGVIEQILLEIRQGDRSSQGVLLVVETTARRGMGRRILSNPLRTSLWMVLAAAIAIGLVLASQR